MPIECVTNLSEGRDLRLIGRLASVCGPDLLDVHVDPDHHRSVFSLAGVDAPRHLATLAIASIDIGRHEGVHPRLGVVDVVPFVPISLAGTISDQFSDQDTMDDALAARDDFARWIADTHGVPVFLYGPDRRTLPDIRRTAWRGLRPDVGPSEPHPTAGSACVGAREPLVAFNVWLEPGTPLAAARSIAATVRGDGVRALGLAVGEAVQVSMNLIEPARVGPAEAHDRVAAVAHEMRCTISRSELVGLVPRSVLSATPHERWSELDLADDRTIESRWPRSARDSG